MLSHTPLERLGEAEDIAGAVLYFAAPIILINRQWRFIFQPLLYDMLSSETKLDIAWRRYDELLAGSNIMFICGSISNIDLVQRLGNVANSSS